MTTVPGSIGEGKTWWQGISRERQQDLLKTLKTPEKAQEQLQKDLLNWRRYHAFEILSRKMAEQTATLRVSYLHTGEFFHYEVYEWDFLLEKGRWQLHAVRKGKK